MMDEALVYLIDDDRDLREAIQETLLEEGLPVRCFSRASEALKVLDPEWGGVIVSDLKMPGLSGMEFLVQANKLAPEIPFIVITAYGDIKSAIEAIKAGAYDFIEKPAAPEYLLNVIRRALDLRRLKQENNRLLQQLGQGEDSLAARLLGESRAMRVVRAAILAVAPLAVDVLITGKTGTGKELAAHCIHDFSPRQRQRFIVVDCAAQKPEHFESDWLGETGYLAQARAGTLFLDELEALPVALQTRLLRYLEDGRTDLHSPRIIAALKVDPMELIEAGELRPAFYHRLNVANLPMPLLQDRGKDWLLLLDHFLKGAAVRYDLKVPTLPPELLKELQHYDWPGNVRELRNTADKLVIGLEVSLGKPEHEAALVSEGYDHAMQQFERHLLKNALLQAAGHKGKAADLLGIPRKRLYLRMKQCGL